MPKKKKAGTNLLTRIHQDPSMAAYYNAAIQKDDGDMKAMEIWARDGFVSISSYDIDLKEGSGVKE